MLEYCQLIKVIAFLGAKETLAEYSVNRDGLTLTSFVFKSFSANGSEWVDRLFGSKAVHNRRNLSPENSTASFRSSFILPKEALHPRCSLELLGFARVGLHNPFIQSNTGVGIGNATIILAHPPSQWSCFYRYAHEDWRTHDDYWPVFFYCPAPNPAACNKLRHYPQDKKILGRFNMELEKTDWTGHFLVNPFMTNEGTRMREKSSAAPLRAMAACLTIPYRTSDHEKEIVNSALLFEWVRYYTSLGMKVIIYDKGGHNYDAIFNSTYGKIQGQMSGRNLENILYHPYTVNGLLNPNATDLKYDNSETPTIVNGMSTQLRMRKTDDDKTSTSTHCRFEASALYGIENVFVSDFDEFLYCPNAAPTFNAQQYWLEMLSAKIIDQNAGGWMATERWLALKSNYTSPSKCMSDKIKQSLSLFECFAPVAYESSRFWLGKTIHYGLKCPLTDFHFSCGNSDCTCHVQVAVPDNDKCFLIHLGTNDKDYIEGVFSNDTKREFESVQMELWHTSKSQSRAA